MKLDINSIKKSDGETRDLNFTLDIDGIESQNEGLTFISPVDVGGRLYSIQEKLFISLNIKTDIEVNCGRCLEKYTHPFISNINAEFIHEDLAGDYDGELDLDTDIIYYHDNIINLEELIRENIIMNIPMKLLCEESCRGLCLSCGIKLEDHSCTCDTNQYEDEQIDPRLAKLKKLL